MVSLQLLCLGFVLGSVVFVALYYAPEETIQLVKTGLEIIRKQLNVFVHGEK